MEVDKTQIEEWKEQYGIVKAATISGIKYYWRPLTREEYVKSVAEQMNSEGYDYEIYVTETCLLGDKNWIKNEIKKKAGIATVLCESILASSGFEQVEVEDV